MSDIKKMTMYISEETHKAVKILSAETGKSMSEIAEEALKKYLEQNQK